MRHCCCFCCAIIVDHLSLHFYCKVLSQHEKQYSDREEGLEVKTSLVDEEMSGDVPEESSEDGQEGAEDILTIKEGCSGDGLWI
ncbi:hypothetical protein K7X08_014680 [Anisodus acutangulus]|uniref:Uncharacterized protein n=1 Tax=Anisodus acutangulus TaxID=402998 RepID=A0A9Q1LKP2_9SOLA|nr:hypothetical protein K7X08_014680 [Anisodus acutangulus]